MNEKLEKEIQDSLVDGKLPCAVAFSIAKKLEVSTRQVGDIANKLDIKVSKCQLGCFP
jgi:hypothetical protein